MNAIGYMVVAVAAFLIGILVGETGTRREANRAELACLKDWGDYVERDVAMLEQLRRDLLELANGPREVETEF